MKNECVFVTGGTGFIGCALVNELAKYNKVYVLARDPSKTKFLKRSIKNIEIIRGDLLDIDFYKSKRFFNIPIDYVFHLAALFRLDGSLRELNLVNITGTRNLLEAISERKIKRFIYFSTTAISGKNEKNGLKEEETDINSYRNNYELSKASAEKLVRCYGDLGLVPVSILRPAVVYGPNSFYGMYNILKLINCRKLYFIPGDGLNRLHLVHVEDVVKASIYISEMAESNRNIYNICDNYAYTLRELIKIACRLLGVDIPSHHIPKNIVRFLFRMPFIKLITGDIPVPMLDYILYNNSYSNEKLKRAGYRFKYSRVDMGLPPTIKWYKDNHYL